MSPAKAVKTVSDWKVMVYRHRADGVGNGVRLLLIYLADAMRTNLQVSVPRSRIARDLGVSAREVTDRIKAAKAAGLLDTVVHGKPGTTAVYVGTFPDMVTTGVPSDGDPVGTNPNDKHGAGNPTMSGGPLGTPVVPATSKHTQTSRFTFQPSRADEEQQQERTPQVQDQDGRSERSDAAERSEDEPARLQQALDDWRTTVHDGWCLTGCGTYLNTPEGQATGYCSDHRKDHAA